MPSVSKQQFKFFKAVENNPQLAKEKGISQKTAQDFTQGMTKQRWGKLKQRVKKEKKD